jgi:hypothetical protein
MSDGREQSGLAWVSGIYAGIDVSREIIESSSILQDTHGTWYVVYYARASLFIPFQQFYIYYSQIWYPVGTDMARSKPATSGHFVFLIQVDMRVFCA